MKSSAIALFLSLIFALRATADSGSPNVLFIAVDDLKPMLGAYGDTDILSPNIDRLAEEGVTFLNAHCQQAVCGPSRASLLTGLRPDSLKVWDFDVRVRDVYPDIVTLPQYFREKGYAAIGMGKISDPRNFEGWGHHDEASWTDYDHVGTTRWLEKYKNGPGTATEILDVPDNAYSDGMIAEAALARLDAFAESGEAFFLAVGFKKPHLPFTAPKRYWDLYDPGEIAPKSFDTLPLGAPEFAFQDSMELRNGYIDTPDEGPISREQQIHLIHGYRACVSYIDAQVGRLMERLRETGLAENTIVVLWGDHGFHLGDHGMFCKHTNYEQATRVPLIIKAPDCVEGGRVAAPVELVDLYPTLCSLVGLPIPEALEGSDLSTLLSDPAGSVKWAAVSQYPRFGDFVPGEYVRDAKSGEMVLKKAPEEGQDLAVMGYAHRTTRYRYVAWIGKDYRTGERDGPLVAEELYDYQVDPLETRNLVLDPSYEEVLRQHRELSARGD